MPAERQHHGEAVGRVEVVVDDQHLERALVPPGRTGNGRRKLGRRGGQRQPHDELAAAAGAGAVGGDAPAVQLDEPARQRQPDAEPALRALQRRRDLREHLEHRRQVLRLDADAVVGHRDPQLSAGHRRLQRDAAAARRVLGRVVEQVQQHLRQPRGIGIEPHGVGRQRHVQRVACRRDGGPRRLERTVHHAVQRHPLAAQRDLAAGDARHVEQVVDEAGHLAHLALDHVARPARVGVARVAQAQDLERVGDGRERVAQLVRQRGQELVLAPV